MDRKNTYACSNISGSLNSSIFDTNHQSFDGISTLNIGIIKKYSLFCIDIAHQIPLDTDVQSNFTDLTSISQKNDESEYIYMIEKLRYNLFVLKYSSKENPVSLG
jgi:hypothetical protein